MSNDKNRQAAIADVMSQRHKGTKLVEVSAMSQKGFPKEVLIVKVQEPEQKPVEHYRFVDKEGAQ